MSAVETIIGEKANRYTTVLITFCNNMTRENLPNESFLFVC